MALPDLSGSNIQDTFQRVLHTDGTSIFDGTGSIVLSSSNLTSLQTMNNNTISEGDWGYVETMDQHVNTTASVQLANITASAHILSQGRFTGNAITLGDSYIETPSYDLHIRNSNASSLAIESWTNNNQTITFLNNQQKPQGEPDFSIGQYHTDGGFQVRSDLKTFLTVGANDGDEIKASGSLKVTSHITASGDISSSGNIFSSNIETIQYTFQNQNSQEANEWYGPNSQGASYYYWNKKFASYPNMGIAHHNSGFKLPHKSELVSCEFMVHCLTPFSANETGSYTGSIIVKDASTFTYPLYQSSVANSDLDEMTRAGVTMSLQYANYQFIVPVSGTYSEGSMIYPRTNVSLAKSYRGNFQLKYRRVL
tara:strand:+ start:537 stop:1640 length:1104 start_codon:yes stop_codon:yes gene_type:complete